MADGICNDLQRVLEDYGGYGGYGGLWGVVWGIAASGGLWGFLWLMACHGVYGGIERILTNLGGLSCTETDYILWRENPSPAGDVNLRIRSTDHSHRNVLTQETA